MTNNEQNKKKEEIMKQRKRNIMGAVLIVLLAMAALPLTVHALGTASNTPIGNTATVVYSVGSVTQPAISTGPTATFVVDNKVNLTVATTNVTYVTSAPSGTAYLTFRVDNIGNTTQDYALTAGASTDPFGGTDDFDAASFSVFVDSNGDSVFTAGTDTLTFIDELVSDGTATVFVVATMPVSVNTGSIAAYYLLATTHDAGGAGLGVVTAQTVTATAGVDVVFADGANAAVGADTARDGEASDRSAFQISTATISILKTGATYSDPFNGTTNPKAIPGAAITYTIAVSNAATGSAATNVTVSDNLTGMPVTFLPQFDDGTGLGCTATQGIAVDTGGGFACNGNNTGDGDTSDFNQTAGNTVTVVIPTLNTGATATIKFQVTIN